MAITTIGTRKTRRRLLTGHLPVWQHHAHGWVVVDGGGFALLGDAAAGMAANRHRDVLLGLAFEEDMRGVALEGAGDRLRGDRRVGSTQAQPEGFRPDEQDRPVARLEALGVASAQ